MEHRRADSGSETRRSSSSPAVDTGSSGSTNERRFLSGIDRPGDAASFPPLRADGSESTTGESDRGYRFRSPPGDDDEESRKPYQETSYSKDSGRSETVPLAEVVVVGLWVTSIVISLYHLANHDAPLLPTIFGQISLLGASLAFGAVAYWCLGRATTRAGRRRIARTALLGFGCGGSVSLIYAIHQHLSPVTVLPAEGVVFQAFFVAVIGGIGGLYVGSAAAVEARTVEQLDRQRRKMASLFENIPDPVLEYEIRDGDIVVRQGNDAFYEYFGVETPIEMSELDDYIIDPDREGEGRELVDAVHDGAELDTEVLRRTEKGRRWFKLRTADHGRGGGFALYTDFTKRRLREQQLQVLNRVLRHNLRNKLTVIKGHGEQLVERIEGPRLQKTAEQLHESTEEILETSGSIQTARERLREDPPRPEPLDVADLVRTNLADRRDDGDDGDYELDAPPEAWALAHPTLNVALDAILENVKKHAEGDAQVRLSIERATADDEDYVSLDLTALGVEIPEQELLAARGDEEPTSLNHATWVDLWIANWFVDQFGGVLVADRLDGGATRFEIKLQPARPDEG